MKLPVNTCILIKSCSKSHRIAEVQTQEFGFKDLVVNMIATLHQRKNSGDLECTTQKGNQQVVDGLGREQEEYGSDQDPVHSIFACKYTQISIVPA